MLDFIGQALIYVVPFLLVLTLVVTIHDVIPLVLPEYAASGSMRLYVSLMRRTVRRARIVLTPSAFSAGEIERVLNIRPERIRVTPLAADPALRPSTDPESARARLAARFGIRGRYLLHMAGVDRRKNVPLLLQAYRRLLDEYKVEVKLVLAGEKGWMYAKDGKLYIPGSTTPFRGWSAGLRPFGFSYGRDELAYTARAYAKLGINQVREMSDANADVLPRPDAADITRVNRDGLDKLHRLVAAMEMIHADEYFAGHHASVGLSNFTVMLPSKRPDGSPVKGPLESAFLTKVMPLGLDMVIGSVKRSYDLLPSDHPAMMCLEECLKLSGFDVLMRVREFYTS